MDYHQSQQRSGSGGSDPDDLFLPTTEGFVSSTRSKFERFEELIDEMKRKFEETLVYFGEDPKDSGAPTVEELFGNFSAFLQSFAVSLRTRVTVLHASTMARGTVSHTHQPARISPWVC